MKKVFLFLIMGMIFSCSKKEETTVTPENGTSSLTAQGKIYGVNFLHKGGFATNQFVNNIQKLSIRLSGDAIDCNNDLYEFPITIITPKSIGLFTTNAIITFRNTNNGDFVSTSNNLQVEIISIGTTIKGKVKGESITENCSINGTFEVPICL